MQHYKAGAARLKRCGLGFEIFRAISMVILRILRHLSWSLEVVFGLIFGLKYSKGIPLVASWIKKYISGLHIDSLDFHAVLEELVLEVENVGSVLTTSFLSFMLQAAAESREV